VHLKPYQQVLGVDELTDGLVQNSIDYIEAFNENKIVYYFKDGRIHEAFWKDRSRRESWTPEMKEMARQRALKQHRKEDN